MMQNKRELVLVAFVAWWGIWAALITGVPFTVGATKYYSTNEGCGTVPYVGLDINNVQRMKMSDFQAVVTTGHPFSGPVGTTFDAVNHRKGGPWCNAAKTTQFGCVDGINKFYGPVNPQKVDIKSPAKMTQLIKDLGLYLGSVSCGVADLGSDPLKWLVSDDFLGNPLFFKPEENKYAIVFLQKEELTQPPLDTQMGIEAVKYQTKVPIGYFHDDYVAGHVAEYIRALGYHAIGHNNGHVNSVAVACLAGLGELGRYGNLMTLRWGPNVRICTVTTDLPLVPDKPVNIGVQDTCDMCTRCYDYCPMNSIPIEKTDFMGVHKWKVNLWRCRQSSHVGLEGNVLHSDTCTICRDVCPFAKPSNFANILGRSMASRSHLGRKFLVKLDDVLYGKWNKYDVGELVKKSRPRMIRVAKGIGPHGEATKAFPEPDWVKLWLSKGATSPEARAKAASMARAYLNGRTYVINGPPEMYENTPVPAYPADVLASDKFGKWPTWTDIWGRKIEGYEDGKPGYPRLDFRPLVAKYSSVTASGVGPAIMPDAPLNVNPQFNTYTVSDPMWGYPFQ